jgi:hypothetical protein
MRHRSPQCLCVTCSAVSLTPALRVGWWAPSGQSFCTPCPAGVYDNPLEQGGRLNASCSGPCVTTPGRSVPRLRQPYGWRFARLCFLLALACKRANEGAARFLGAAVHQVWVLHVASRQTCVPAAPRWRLFPQVLWPRLVLSHGKPVLRRDLQQQQPWQRVEVHPVCPWDGICDRWSCLLRHGLCCPRWILLRRRCLLLLWSPLPSGNVQVLQLLLLYPPSTPPPHARPYPTRSPPSSCLAALLNFR